MKIKVKKLFNNVQLPVYGSAGAACFDLHAYMQLHEPELCVLDAHTPAVFHTGLSFEIPEGFVMLIFSRSGHGFKNDVRLANCVGVIDSDYRGEVCVKLSMDAYGQFVVKHGDRIAQAMIMPVPTIEFEEGELSDTSRGTGGFGSTGK